MWECHTQPATQQAEGCRVKMPHTTCNTASWELQSENATHNLQHSKLRTLSVQDSLPVLWWPRDQTSAGGSQRGSGPGQPWRTVQGWRWAVSTSAGWYCWWSPSGSGNSSHTIWNQTIDACSTEIPYHVKKVLILPFFYLFLWILCIFVSHACPCGIILCWCLWSMLASTWMVLSS